MKSSLHPQNGATLLEVLVAVLIFSFGLLGLMGLQSRSIQYSVNTDDRNRAAALASELAAHMYTLRSIDLANTDPAALAAWYAKVSTVASGGIRDATGTVTVTAAAGSTPAFATIVIQWQPINTTKPSRYETDVLPVTATVPIPAPI